MPDERYVVDRSDAFATLYDRLMRRAILENADEGYCRRVLTWLTAPGGYRPEVFEAPSGCRWCGDLEFHHGGQSAPGVGLHRWAKPWDWQVMERMLARRRMRLEAPPPIYHAATHWTGSIVDPEDEGDALCADCLTPCDRYDRIQDRRLRAQCRAWGVRIDWRRKSSSGWGGPDVPF